MLQVVSFLYFASLAFALNIADYPPMNQIPPINSAWGQNILKNQIKDTGIISNCPNVDSWGLTYDDGPGAFTDSVVNDLGSVNIKSTFFVVGSQVLQYPNSLLNAYKAGHQIAIHTWSHQSLVNITDDEIISEIVWTARIIRDVIGVTPSMIRPPYGNVDDRVQKIITNLGLKTILWNRDTSDWCFSTIPPSAPCASTDVPTIIPGYFEKWISEPLNGTISLEHDLAEIPSKQILPSLKVLLTSKYKVTSVAECLSVNAYDENLWNRLNGVENVLNNTTNNGKNTTTTKNNDTRSNGGDIINFSIGIVIISMICMFV
jgi:peptidoglycan/xylan/chitin deacetylase (PgdA/CDA1 family)